MSRTVSFLALVLLLACWRSAEAEADKAKANGPPPAQPQVGRFVRVTSPITDKVDARVRRAVNRVMSEAKRTGQWPVLVFEIDPGPTEYGQALDLARFLSSETLNGAKTVAYLPKTLTGHAVLVAMACDEIIMQEDAQLGKAGESEQDIPLSMRNAYSEIANRRKTIPADVALGLLDPALEVVQVETEVSREYVLASRLEQLRKEKTVQASKVLLRAGEPHLLSGRQARELGFVKYLASDRRDVAQALGLPREALKEDPALAGDLRPVRIDLKGPINAKSIDQAQRMIEDQIRREDVNFVCLWIDSPGGSPADSLRLASYLAGLDPGQRRTVAYVPKEARADAAFVALACDDIVMGPSAVLGGPGAYQLPDEDIPLTVEAVEQLARKKSRSTSLPAAMVNPNLAVFRYSRTTDGLVDYFSEKEAAAQEHPDAWRKQEAVTVAGQAFRATGDEAEQYGLARGVAENFEDFKRLYGLEGAIALVEPGWADFLIDALNSPGVAWLLLLIGGAALYIELHTPGMGVGGFIAGVCFLLYFWSRHLGGTAGWLEVLLFLAGLSCILLEVFVIPGFGIFGLGGGAMVLASLVLASQTFVVPRNEYQVGKFETSLLVIAGAVCGVGVGAVFLRRMLPHAPVFSRMMLHPPEGEELAGIARREALVDFQRLVGTRGTTTTQLTPGGKARFGNDLVDVMADGEIIASGTEVIVVEVRGNRVLVKAVGSV
ncbi:MAG: NfeD family protein [Pirellulales bacterium]